MWSRSLSRSATPLGLISITAGVPASVLRAQSSGPLGPEPVTFTRDIVPILQRSCQQCHTADGGAPMSLVTYEEVRPFARAIKQRTSMGARAGVMPPWFIEKTIGIQHYKADPSLSDAEIAKVAAWVDAGAPRGNPADMPPPRAAASGENGWLLGTPDLIVKSPDVFVPAIAPDRWG